MDLDKIYTIKRVLCGKEVKSVFRLIPDNQDLPDDLYLIKCLERRGKTTYYAPSIIVHDSDLVISEKELEEAINYRRAYGAKSLAVDIVVQNNSYLPISGRKVGLFYVEQEKVKTREAWKAIKSISGDEKIEIERVLPCQEGWTRESFLFSIGESKPYFLIAVLDQEENEMKVEDDFIDLNQLNESYYFCILDSNNLGGGMNNIR